MSKPETDCLKRPEGSTPLIFWEWLKAGRRSIEHNPTVRSGQCWHTWDNGKHSFQSETAGGLAAQLAPFTSFADDFRPAQPQDGLSPTKEHR